MCMRKVMDIKSVSSNAPKLRFIPCGVCAECRNLKKADWAFRLRAEFEALVSKGWQVGFVTLTYNRRSIPRIPRYWLNGRGKAEFVGKHTPYCFSRTDINLFIKHVRNWLYREKGICKDKKLRFFVASEFGSSTKRPHYHALFAFPPSVDSREFFDEVKTAWSYRLNGKKKRVRRGFIIPKDFEGGLDKKGHYHKPFIVDCLRDATKYCAKYVSKDLDYFEYFDSSMFYKKLSLFDGSVERLNQFFPFHSQSKSIGASFLESLDDKTRISYYLDGVSWVGEDKLRQLPVYLKNKLVYNNYYVFDAGGKRLCRRVASEFFERYAPLIYVRKLKCIESVVNEWFDGKYYDRYSDSERALVTSFLLSYNPDVHTVSGDYLAFGGCNPKRCFDVDRMRFWYSRYVCVTDGVDVSDVDFAIMDDKGVFPCNLMNSDYLDKLNAFFLINQKYDTLSKAENDALLLANERRIDLFRDRYFNQQQGVVKYA